MAEENININNGFAQVKTKLITDHNLTDCAFRTLSFLMSFKFGQKGRVFPSIETLAIGRGKTTTSIINHLNELREKGYLTSKRRGYSESNEYFFINKDIFTIGTIAAQESYTSQSKKTTPHYSINLEGNHTTNNTELINNNNSLKGESYEKRKSEIYNKLPWLKKEKKPQK